MRLDGIRQKRDWELQDSKISALVRATQTTCYHATMLPLHKLHTTAPDAHIPHLWCSAFSLSFPFLSPSFFAPPPFSARGQLVSQGENQFRVSL